MAGAKANQVEAIQAAGGQKPSPNSFLALLRAQIEQLAPRNLDEADKFMEGGEKEQIKAAAAENVRSQKEAATGPTEQATAAPPDVSQVPGKEVTPMPAEPATAPAVVPAGDAMPAPRPDSATEPFEKSKQDAEQQMKDAEVTDVQLQKANDPRFSAVLAAKNDVQQQATAAPGQFRAVEGGVLSQAVATATEDGKQGVAGLMAAKALSAAGVKSSQQGAKGQDEARRKEVTDRIESIFQRTKQKVESKLSTLEVDVMAVFDAGAERALSDMKEYANREIDKFKEERYGGPDGAVRWVADLFLPTPEGIKKILRDARTRFMGEMDALAVRVADMVDRRMAEASAEVASGEAEIKSFVGSLKGELKEVGLAAQQDVAGRFEELRSSIDNKKNELATKLAEKYKETTEKLDAALKKLEEENAGALKKFTDALDEVIKILAEAKTKLMALFKRGWDTIKLIIEDPIGFLGNLLAAIKGGFNQFAGNIWAHLKRGFSEWLFGSLAEAGIQVPADLNVWSILKLVLDVVGLTATWIRGEAVKLIGERNMALIEKLIDYVMITVQGGPQALWEKLKEDLSNLKEMVVDAIQDWVVTTIVKQAIVKVVSMFNPVGAIVQAVIAIYNVVMWVVENASRLGALVESVVGSVHAIATGAIGGAVKRIEQALGSLVPIVIAFLARLLGLGGISAKIRELITKVQTRVRNAVLGWLKKAWAWVKKSIGSLLGRGTTDRARGRPGANPPEDPNAALDGAILAAEKIIDANPALEGVGDQLAAIQGQYGLKRLEIRRLSSTELSIQAEINPKKSKNEKLSPKQRLKACIKRNLHGKEVKIQGRGDPRRAASQAEITLVQLRAQQREIQKEIRQLDIRLVAQERLARARGVPEDQITKVARDVRAALQVARNQLQGVEAGIAGIEHEEHVANREKPDLRNVKVICVNCENEVQEFDMVKGKIVLEAKISVDAVKVQQIKREQEVARKLWKDAEVMLALPAGPDVQQQVDEKFRQAGEAPVKVRQY